jgi:hypothetical protein
MLLPDLKIWLNHFEYHAANRRPVPAGLSDDLTPEERQRIARSIAAFQLGESSEGKSLLRAATRRSCASPSSSSKKSSTMPGCSAASWKITRFL